MRRRPIILGLTGSIAMGKSDAAKVFGRLGVPVFDADAVVHRMLAKGGEAVEVVARSFPGVINDGAIDRRRLGDRVFGKGNELKKLEHILHPLVGKARNRFLRLAGASRTRVVVMDVPLLFETGGMAGYHAVVVVSAPHFVQRSRALRRPGMTTERFASIVQKQVPDHLKCRQADFIVFSGLGKRSALIRICRILRMARAGLVWRGKLRLKGQRSA